ncbi:MAG: tetratricopeptide repeat protein [Polyangiaceae bacterium]
MSPTAARAALLRVAELVREGANHAGRALLDEVRRERVGTWPNSLHVAAARLSFVVRDYSAGLDELDLALSRSLAAPTRNAILRVKLDLTSRLEWNQEVLDTAEELLALEQDPAAARAVHLVLARLYLRHGRDRAALAHVDKVLAREPALHALRLQRVELQLRANPDSAPALAELRALEKTGALADGQRLTLAWLAARAGAVDDARRALEDFRVRHPSELSATILSAELALWLGDARSAYQQADEALRSAPDTAALLRIRGGAAVLYGDCQLALADLDRALELDSEDTATWVFRAEARLRLGDYAGAQTDLHAALGPSSGYVLSAALIRILVIIRGGETPWSLTYGAYSELLEALLFLCPEARPTLEAGNPSRVALVLEEALAALGGNRTGSQTYVQRDDSGRRTLARLPVLTAPRHASRRALNGILASRPAEALREFDEIIRRYPQSSLPICHRGELQSWLGNYQEARADLEAAIAKVRHTRWAYIGLTALDVLAGDPEKALETCELGVRTMGYTTGPAVYGIRGEAHRLLGNRAEALVDLEAACRLNPSRISAFLNLGLLRGELGDEAGALTLYRDLVDRASGLMSDAAAAVGLADWPEPERCSSASRGEVLRAALAMMRGNRSSSCITYFDARGRLRTAPGMRANEHIPTTRDDEDRRRAVGLLENVGSNPFERGPAP